MLRVKTQRHHSLSPSLIMKNTVEVLDYRNYYGKYRNDRGRSLVASYRADLLTQRTRAIIRLANRAVK